MYASLRLRQTHELRRLCSILAQLTVESFPLRDHQTISPPATAMSRSLTTPDLQHYYHSTASSPSLRSRTPVDVDMSRPETPTEGDGGHVKVVVRCRKFIKRGE